MLVVENPEMKLCLLLLSYWLLTTAPTHPCPAQASRCPVQSQCHCPRGGSSKCLVRLGVVLDDANACPSNYTREPNQRQSSPVPQQGEG